MKPFLSNPMNAASNPGGISDISPAVADPGNQRRNMPRIPAGMPEDAASPGTPALSAIPAGIESAFSSDIPGCIRVADDPGLISPIPPGSLTDHVLQPVHPRLCVAGELPHGGQRTRIDRADISTRLSSGGGTLRREAVDCGAGFVLVFVSGAGGGGGQGGSCFLS